MTDGAGPPGLTGICLSGGGLRAASFSLGILQTLQSQRRLLYGPDSAHWLAVVSGGSYIAATHVLGGRERAKHPGHYADAPPLAPGSGEEAHILDNGRYLLGAPWRWPLLWLLTFSSLVALFAWAGFLLADYAALAVYLPDGFERDLAHLPAAVSAVAVFAGFVLAIAGLYSEGKARGAVVGLCGVALIYLCGGPSIEWAAGLDIFRTWGQGLRTAAFLTGLLVVIGCVTWVLRKLKVTGLVAAALNIASALITRLLGFLVVAVVAIQWYPEMRALFANDPNIDELMLGAGLVGSLVGPLLFDRFASRASLHREYRGRLESCFGVARGADGAPRRIEIADMSTAPPNDGERRFPQLLVLATANVRRRDPAGRRWTFKPFILGHDTCGVASEPGAEFATTKLELGRVPASLFTSREEPLVSLFTAVAATGAAVSPSMGRHTVPSIRPVIAALNFRLGRWVPNPYSAEGRKVVTDRREPGRFGFRRRLGPGYDELVPEMLGLDGPRVYLSDGGHYDNLGLLALLRREPEQVWCVDASPDPRGRAAELRRVLGIARDELKVVITLDCDGFRRQKDRLYGASHAVGGIAYESGRKGQLIVLKLGLTSSSPAHLRKARGFLGFPHHPTWRQVYPRTRIERYRDLGRSTAQIALAAIGKGVPARERGS